ncbi:Mitochondrial amidoxime reducing component 2 [Halocaridina rubra]|uniref:Mitochondrial amidoxime reducing component 2 n=1 Tax=Halocaridina rubra TaxID=373956 RepID=A0AAN8WEN6_HALRR
MRIPEQTIAVGVGVGVGALLAGWWAWKHYTTPLPHTWEEIGEVSELKIFPVKSAHGIAVDKADATILGLSCGSLEDRAFAIINTRGTCLSSRHAGALATIETALKGQILTLKAKGFKDISVDIVSDLKDHTVLETRLANLRLPGVDCGDKVAEWLSQVLYNGEEKIRLIYKGDVLKNRPASNPHKYNFYQHRKSDIASYTNYCSYMIASQSSLDDLNTRLSDPVTMRNFRPNIVVEGTKAYDEDDWAYVRIGPVQLRRLRPCERCLLITVDTDTGIFHPEKEPLRTLNGYRCINDPPELAKLMVGKPIFGVLMSIDKTGSISVGDKVYVARASVHPHLRGY